MIAMRSGSVYLVPGFFGFSELCGFNYFYRVAETLERELRARGYRAQIVECRTLPTGRSRRAPSACWGT